VYLRLSILVSQSTFLISVSPLSGCGLCCGGRESSGCGFFCDGGESSASLTTATNNS